MIKDDLYLCVMNLDAGIKHKAMDWLARYFPLIMIGGLAFICANIGSRGLHLPMYGFEYQPPLSSILLHIFSHNDPAHFLGNYLGLFFYAVLFGLTCRRVDLRMNNRLFLGALTGAVILSILFGLIVVPNDNGVTGISGVVNYLMGYFWVGCAPILMLTFPIKRKRRTAVRWQRRAKQHPLLLAGLFMGATLVAHGLLDGFAGFNPYGANAVGNLYHLIGYSSGCVAGFISVARWSDRVGVSSQRLALRQSHGI